MPYGREAAAGTLPNPAGAQARVTAAGAPLQPMRGPARAGRGEHTLTALADSGAWAQLRFRVTGVGEPSAQVLEHVVGR